MAECDQCRQAPSSPHKSRPAPTDARARGSRKAHQKGVPTVLGRERCREHRSERRDRAIHQSCESRLYDLQYEQTPLSFFLLVFNAGWKFLLVQFLRTVFVFAFFGRQVVKKLADARVLGASRSLFVEEAGFD